MVTIPRMEEVINVHPGETIAEAQDMGLQTEEEGNLHPTTETMAPKVMTRMITPRKENKRVQRMRLRGRE